jgi:transposase
MDLRQENSSFTRENFNILLNQNAQLFAENKHLKLNLETAEKKLNWLTEQIRLSKHRQFSNKSECGKFLQLELAFDELAEGGVDGVEDAEAEAEPAEGLSAGTETITYTRKKKAVGRRIDTSKLSREIIVHDLSESEKSCAKCGKELKRFGEDRSEQLEYIPAQVKVIEHVVPKYKYSCKCCDTVKFAPKPETPLPKSMAGASLITEVIIKKYQHHLPWYRQSQIFAQDGLDIPANTICNWFMQRGIRAIENGV